MLTILSALGGLAASLLPDLIHGFFGGQQDRRDKAQELALVTQQLALEAAKSETERVAAQGRLAERGVEADIAESEALNHRITIVGVKWVDALNASVRPVLTYAFFFMFMGHRALLGLMSVGAIGDAGSMAALTASWALEADALFAAIMGFWFGERALRHAKGETR